MRNQRTLIFYAPRTLCVPGAAPKRTGLTGGKVARKSHRTSSGKTCRIFALSRQLRRRVVWLRSWRQRQRRHRSTNQLVPVEFDTLLRRTSQGQSAFVATRILAQTSAPPSSRQLFAESSMKRERAETLKRTRRPIFLRAGPSFSAIALFPARVRRSPSGLRFSTFATCWIVSKGVP